LVASSWGQKIVLTKQDSRDRTGPSATSIDWVKPIRPIALAGPLSHHIAAASFVADAVAVVYPGVIVEIASSALPFRS
jgi:hypothetical protein